MAASSLRNKSAPATQPRLTQRDEFLDAMDLLLPWPRLCAIVKQHRRDGGERFPAGIERMLRVCFIQSWFGLSDRACEDALIDSLAFRRFARIDEKCPIAPDARAIQQFRSVLQSQQSAAALLAEVNGVMAANGIRIKAGTITNARIVANLSAGNDEASERAASGNPPREARSYGDAYGSLSMRFRQAPARAPSTTDASARVAQAVANIERIATAASRPVPRRKSANH
ncbi:MULTISPECIES: transposase [unclassified Caballeronia]|uniref:transposase n=1 Tax=unclassified Caballeronia TaxID=2646786 RepID=UPI002864FE46|nr:MULTISPECIES: transposase [unclassified Caballeronia]MDR5738261.1 transposase [Caballeronia sp. LZ016]MDR5811883.1 transposase [Caballeronia sp. LZ019]